MHACMTDFLPPVARWFVEAFAGPSPAQALAWPVIRRGDNTLLLAPTGSGKTLAAFLCAIDELYRKSARGELTDGIHVLYVTPLKALGNDIQKNLLLPLAGIRAADESLPELRVAVRSGDTPQSERARMLRQPPHILITTPESLYLLLGSAGMAEALRSVRTVIVDEVHALCAGKRGAHLAVSLERLQHLVGSPLQRVGCSATLRPLEEIAAFLVGCEADGSQRPCTIVNAGMRKELDVQVMAPLPDFLEASHSALWASAYDLLLHEIHRHNTTLIFSNSRYKAERTVLRLRELADSETRVGVHHGSMSKELRLEAEDDLKAGRLQALVATASLELGIDIGAVDLVYQLESPKSVATGLQRVGRAGHLLHATSKGRMLIFERDELLEAAAICKSMLDGEVDRVRIPRGCLDVLAQQIAGAVAAGEWQAEALLTLIRRAYPYTALTSAQFEAVLGMLAGEFPFEMTRPPRALLLWDRAGGRLSPTRSSAHVCAMNVGTIAENAEYEVALASNNKRVGTVQSEFVDDCLRTGDIFTLGSSAWKVVCVRRNRLLVEEAPGSTPTVPWWLGAIESRTAEVGARVAALRREVTRRLDDADVESWLAAEYHLCPDGARAIVEYLREQLTAAGIVPDDARLLMENWHDELGRLNLILHSPFGQRINKTWGIAIATALKTRYQQEWAVNAGNDVLLLSRTSADTPRHEADITALIATMTPEELPALLAESADHLISFSSGFRDAAVSSFQILRAWQGKRVPLWLQNHRAQELYEQAGVCRDYPVVAEVLREYLQDTLDVPGVQQVLAQIASGAIELVCQTVECPSPFAHSVLIQDRYRDDHQMGRDRRAYLLRLHRQVLQEVLSAEQMAQLLDVRAIDDLERRLLHRSETTQARTADELAQVIRDLGDFPATLEALAAVVDGDAAALLAPLVQEGRVVAMRLPDCEQESIRLLSADQWRQYYDAFHHAGRDERITVLLPRIEGGTIAGFAMAEADKLIPARWRERMTQEDARAVIIERFLRCRGPVTLYEIANHTGWPVGVIQEILDALTDAGKAARGVYTSNKPRPQWVNRVNLEEIHRLTMHYLKRELSACAPYEVVDFMLRWQHVHPATRLHGVDGVREVVRQLQGIEVMQAALEHEVLPARVADYQPAMLDALIAAGEVCWRRVSTQRIKRGTLGLCLRKEMAWLGTGAPLQFDVEQGADADIPEVICAVRDYFRAQGTAFFDEVVAAVHCDAGAVMRAVWYLAWCGELSCDTYECVRYADFQVTLSACYDLDSTPWKIMSGRMTAERVIRAMERRRLNPRLGRWSATERLTPAAQPLPQAEVIRRWAEQLLARWGIVSKDILAAEVAAPPWSALVREFKRMELLGQINRGYFIESHHGEQYGLPEAIELLRDCRARRGEGKTLGYLPDEPIFSLTNRDPANLYCCCLDIIEERGEVLQVGVRQGNLIRRMAVQAGQVLVVGDRQLVTLERRQLARCIEALQHDYAGNPVSLFFSRWNDYPIGTGPVAGLLSELGFRCDSRGEMGWPPPKTGTAVPATPQQVFPPYYAETAPEANGLEWCIENAAEPLRPALRRLLEVLIDEPSRQGWTVQWGARYISARYGKHAGVSLYPARSFIDLCIWRPALRDTGKRYIHRYRQRVTRDTALTEDHLAELRGQMREAKERMDEFQRN